MNHTSFNFVQSFFCFYPIITWNSPFVFILLWTVPEFTCKQTEALIFLGTNVSCWVLMCFTSSKHNNSESIPNFGNADISSNIFYPWEVWFRVTEVAGANPNYFQPPNHLWSRFLPEKTHICAGRARIGNSNQHLLWGYSAHHHTTAHLCY